MQARHESARANVGRERIGIVQIRASEALVGDVINRRGAVREGWIEVASIEGLPDGQVLISDHNYRQSFTSQPLDLLWVQVVEPFSERATGAIALPAAS